jgi:hypothetical protein
VLRDLKDKTAEKYFVLHNFSNNLSIDERPVSLSSSTSSSSTTSSATRMAAGGTSASTSKVFPENQRHYYSHHPVMTRLDSNTEAILKRVDAALEAFEPNTQPIKKDNANPNFPSPMSVSRNEGGVDIHLPHGLLRSTVLNDQKTQYSLMKFPNTLVLQKIMPERKPLKQQQGKVPVSGEEMATLVKYGSQYLDTYDTANKINTTPHQLDHNRLFVEKDTGKSLSSLEDLEKVSFLYRQLKQMTNFIFYRNYNVSLLLIHHRTKALYYIYSFTPSITFLPNYLITFRHYHLLQ